MQSNPSEEAKQPSDNVLPPSSGKSKPSAKGRKKGIFGRSERNRKTDRNTKRVRVEKGGKQVDINSLCSVCRTKNSGLVAMCLRCGHGGHLRHIQEWFGSHESKPRKCAVASCHCECVFEEESVL